MIKNIKTVHFTTVHHPLDTRIYHKQCKSLADYGYEVILIATYHDDLKKYNVYETVKLITLKKAKNRLVRMTRSVYEAYKIAKELDADIYQFHDPELIPAGLLLKKKEKKVIYDIHEDYPSRIMIKNWIPKILRKVIAKLYGILELVVAKYFDAIICTELDVKKRLGDKATIIENAPLVNGQAVDLAYIYSKQIYKSDIFRTVFVGGMSKARGLFNMVKAIELVNKEINCRLWLAGTCSSEEEWKEAQTLPGWKYVDFLGRLTQAEAYSYIIKSDAGLITYLPEGGHERANPNKIYEYQRFGIPFIASDFESWKNKFKDIKSGIFVDPTDVEQIANAILFLAKNNEQSKKMGYNGQVFIVNEYNWEIEAKKLLNVYEVLIRER